MQNPTEAIAKPELPAGEPDPIERPATRRARRSASPGAVWQVEHRQRVREGLRCYWVPIHADVIATLIDRGLPPQEALDPKAVGRELGAVLLQWVARWRREKNFP